ncbi:hypothetical protein A0H81_14078 [Grifola frondosa]|uniref:Uncharacterized protein n=1 Tax=Grifola frondosa TaxID=5627 RepID=A0A1C7LNS3_GRIFR|nr:hypothetical protein A0H81_14078 [Grifola frondosa]
MARHSTPSELRRCADVELVMHGRGWTLDVQQSFISGEGSSGLGFVCRLYPGVRDIYARESTRAIQNASRGGHIIQDAIIT